MDEKAQLLSLKGKRIVKEAAKNWKPFNESKSDYYKID